MTASVLPVRTLRFGVLCEREELAGWQLDCIDKLEQLEGVSAALLIVHAPSRIGASGSGRPASRQRRGSLVWRLYRRAMLDRASTSTRLHPLPAALAKLPLKRCVPEKPASGSGLEEIRGFALDFIVDFGSGDLTGEILEVARHGVWSFHFGDLGQSRTEPPGFWEIYRGEPVTKAFLTRLSNEAGASAVLRSGVFKTNRWSYGRNRDQLFKAAATWPARVCKDLGEESIASLGDVPDPRGSTDRGEPSNAQTLRFLARLVGGFLRELYRWLFRHQQWRVGIVDVPVHQLAGLSGGSGEAPAIRWLANPEGRYLADPFAVAAGGDEDGDLLLLAEDYHWPTAHGRISAVRVAEQQATEPEPVFELPYHMSYPYLFRHEGRLFCVPESNEAREVSLYVLNEQTSAWTRECVLITGRRLADSTLLQWNGYWWLFATDVDDHQVLKLHAWLAPELRGPWREHPANPVKTDIRSSRPAGRPFVHEGSLYRPAQDCSQSYGGAVAINKVLRMTPTQYLEETVSMVRPRKEWPVPDGLHHLCGVGERTIIDACREVFVWRALVAKVLGKFGGLRSSRR